MVETESAREGKQSVGTQSSGPIHRKQIITHGRAFDGGMLYEATFNANGQFAPALDEETKTLAEANSDRGSTSHTDCD